MNAVAVIKCDPDFDVYWCELVCMYSGNVIYVTDRYGEPQDARNAMEAWVAWYNGPGRERWTTC